MVNTVLCNITNSPKRQRTEYLTPSKLGARKNNKGSIHMNNNTLECTSLSISKSARLPNGAENEEEENDNNEHHGKTPIRTPMRANKTGTDSKFSQPREGDSVAPNTVAKLKDWLIEFEQKNKEHSTKKQPKNSVEPRRETQRFSMATGSPRSSTKSGSHQWSSASKVPISMAAAPSSPVNQHVDFIRDDTPCDTPVQCALRKFDPHKEKPTITKNEVEATNDGYAPVHKLSEWLAAKPFEEKKKTPSKGSLRGSSIKSFTSGRDQQQLPVTDPALIDTSVDVSDKKKWLENAFQKREARQDDNVEEEPLSGVTKIKEVLERRQKEISKTTNPKANMKIKWDAAGPSHGQYKKKVVDERGLPPKKRLTDLP